MRGISPFMACMSHQRPKVRVFLPSKFSRKSPSAFLPTTRATLPILLLSHSGWFTTFTDFPIRRSSVIFSPSVLRPSWLLYGRLRKTSFSGKSRISIGMGPVLTPNSEARRSKTSSQLAKILSEAKSSSCVRCNETIALPNPAPERALRAVVVTTRSAFMPQSDEPTAMQRSAFCSHSSSHSIRSERSVPDMGTTGFETSYHAPWISLMCCCGKPAFWGRPS
mmetsp:Transcript_22364/g.45266  ORF Transcript_22364/g.45266 Transcript_22364/m.45266 type:complete len:222 (-) Transcript_22364:1101-1766(-)